MAGMQQADVSRCSSSVSAGAATEGEALLQQVLGSRARRDGPSHKDFGLGRWKEYAVLKHGNNARFQSSVHGREMIKIAALREYETEVRLLRSSLESDCINRVWCTHVCLIVCSFDRLILCSMTCVTDVADASTSPQLASACAIIGTRTHAT